MDCLDVGRSQNPGGHNLSTLIEIGVTNLSKIRGAIEPQAPTGLDWIYSYFVTAALINLLILPRECPFLAPQNILGTKVCSLRNNNKGITTYERP